MGGLADAITGASARRQESLARQSQARQEADLAKQKADVEAVASGQRAAARTGGGGLLAYLPEEDRNKMRSKLGG